MKPTNLLAGAVLIGSLWAFSEVVIGALLRAADLPLRGALLTGIGVAILLAGLGWHRRPRVVAMSVAATVIIKYCCAPAFGFGPAVFNATLAVLLLGTAVSIAVASVHRRLPRGRFGWALPAGIAALGAGTGFYFLGSHLAPCAYLSSLTAFDFLWRESLPGALCAALAGPLGFACGRQLAARWEGAGAGTVGRVRLATAGVIAGCWLGCAAVVILTS